MQGTLKFFKQDKAYGFITPDEGGKDIFVHISGLKGGLTSQDMREGQRLEFSVVQGSKGEQAVDVRLA